MNPWKSPCCCKAADVPHPALEGECSTQSIYDHYSISKAPVATVMHYKHCTQCDCFLMDEQAMVCTIRDFQECPIVQEITGDNFQVEMKL